MNVLDIQGFFSILAFHINDTDHDFRAFGFDAAHEDHNLNFCVYCVCPDLFLCLYQYTQQNVSKSSTALHMKHIKKHKKHYKQSWQLSKQTRILYMKDNIHYKS